MTTTKNPYLEVMMEKEYAQRQMAAQNPVVRFIRAAAGLIEGGIQMIGKTFAPSVSFANKVERSARAIPLTLGQRDWLWDLAYARSRELYYAERMVFDALDAGIFARLHAEEARAAVPLGMAYTRKEVRAETRMQKKIDRTEARAAKKLAKLEAEALKTVEKTAKAEAKIKAKAVPADRNALHHRKTA